VYYQCGKHANKLPSRTTVQRMNVERLVISQQQIAELTNERNTTLYTDETSKFGIFFYGYHISTEEGQFYSLG